MVCSVQPTERRHEMRYRLRPSPNLTWIVVPVLLALWLAGFVNGWQALGIFLVYFTVAFIVVWKNPTIQKEAQEFGRRVALGRQQERAAKISRALQASVQTRKK